MVRFQHEILYFPKATQEAGVPASSGIGKECVILKITLELCDTQDYNPAAVA